MGPRLISPPPPSAPTTPPAISPPAISVRRMDGSLVGRMAPVRLRSPIVALPCKPSGQSGLLPLHRYLLLISQALLITWLSAVTLRMSPPVLLAYRSSTSRI